MYPNHCFKSFYPEYFADNQMGKIIENDIFRLFDIHIVVNFFIN